MRVNQKAGLSANWKILSGIFLAVGSYPGEWPFIQPLQPNVAYCLFVTAGRSQGQHDFEIGGSRPEPK
jgi:hypothetical protein